MPKKQPTNPRGKSTKNIAKSTKSISARQPRKSPQKVPSLSPIRLKDPMLAREQRNYAAPLPSREYILEVMEKHGRPISPASLEKYFGIHPEEKSAFQNRLKAMCREGQTMLNRRGLLILPDSAGLLEGRVISHRDGYGFFAPSDGSEDLFLSEREMRKVLSGDQVLVRRMPETQRNRSSGKIVEVIKRANETVVGRLLSERKVWFLSPEDKSMPQMVISPEERQKTKKWRSGLYVTGKILEQPTEEAPALVEVQEILGDAATAGIEVEVSIRRYGLPHEFSKAVTRLADSRAKPVKLKDIKNRRDLRDLALVTIDGETARDFDDAVYAEVQGNGHRLIVAIADVSHYVKPDDALDKEAVERGNSVYFPSHVLPMLPENLSNGMCSLNPGEDRLTMVCDMHLNEEGEVTSYEFYSAVIESKARLTYETVYEFLYEDDDATITHLPIIQSLKHLKTVYERLHNARKRRGSIDFELPETRIVFGENGKIESIVPTERNDAHRLIEECMLAANVCAAEFLLAHKKLGLYRVHESPHSEKLNDLRSQLKVFGLPLEGGNDPTSADFAKTLALIQSHPTLSWMQMSMLRSFQQAVYSPQNAGHFALSYDAYTHFTSPIRRYPDLVVHRLIKEILNIGPSGLDRKKVETIAKHCSMTERRADNATRDAVAWLKCEYMQDKIGMVFEGTISTIVGFGVFVLLDDLYVEGLVHVSDLGKDYFEFDASRSRMIGQRSGFEYRVGDRLTVRLASVNLDRRQIDFVLVDFPQQNKAKGQEKDLNALEPNAAAVKSGGLSDSPRKGEVAARNRATQGRKRKNRASKQK